MVPICITSLACSTVLAVAGVICYTVLRYNGKVLIAVD
jgi:hypothetical protein